MFNTIIQFIEATNPWFYGLILTLYNITIIPFPSEPIILAAGSIWVHQKPLILLITVTAMAAAGAISYLVGMWLGKFTEAKMGNNKAYQRTLDLLHKHGVWAVMISAVLPIPYSLVSWLCGAARTNFIHFMLAAIVSRGLRVTIALLLLWEIM